MNKQLIISLVLLVTIAGAGTFALLQNSDSENSATSEPSSNSTVSSLATNTRPPEMTNTSGNGTYTDYEESAFNSASGKKVLFFHAPWCWQCRSIEGGITAGSVPDDVTIFKVDYDSRQDLRKKYDVKLQTTFIVINESGEVEKNYVAYEDPYFDSVKRAIL